jgi:type I restriction enzyme M protein
VASFKADNRNARTPSERWRPFTYDEISARDKASLDIFWLKDEDLEDLESLPDPDVLAEEIAEDLRAALEQFTALAEGLEKRPD